jgi:hypothetical protein
MNTKQFWQWEHHPETKTTCGLSACGSYIISHRPKLFTASYRPANTHQHIAQTETLEEAMRACEAHYVAKYPFPL